MRQAIKAASGFDDVPIWLRISGDHQVPGGYEVPKKIRTRKVKRVRLYNDTEDYEFESTRDAACFLGVCKNTITSNINCGYKCSGKYYAEYVEEK